MVQDLKVSVEGLAEFNRALRKLDSDLPKGLRLALNSAANVLVDETRKVMPHRSGRAQASLKARSTRTSARVSMGGPKAPYVPWLDFGGRTGRNKSVNRPFFSEGRYLYPTLRRTRPQIEKALDEALRGVARDAGIEVD